MNLPTGIEWIGRYFNINFQGMDNLVRSYTTIQCYSKPNQIQLKQILLYYNEIQKNNTNSEFFNSLRPTTKHLDTLQFVIKRYPKPENTFSNLLFKKTDFNQKIFNSKFIIKGPLGTGLKINKEL